MSQHPEEKPVSADRLLEDVRRLSEQDYQAYRRLVEQILADGSSSLSREVIVLAKTLGFAEDEVLEAAGHRRKNFKRHFSPAGSVVLQRLRKMPALGRKSLAG